MSAWLYTVSSNVCGEFPHSPVCARTRSFGACVCCLQPCLDVLDGCCLQPCLPLQDMPSLGVRVPSPP